MSDSTISKMEEDIKRLEQINLNRPETYKSDQIEEGKNRPIGSNIPGSKEICNIPKKDKDLDPFVENQNDETTKIIEQNEERELSSKHVKEIMPSQKFSFDPVTSGKNHAVEIHELKIQKDKNAVFEFDWRNILII